MAWDVGADEYITEGVTVTPDPAAAVAGNAGPTVVLGSLTITPTALSAIAAIGAPTVVHGSITIAPTAASAIGAVIAPTVDTGNVFITPEAAAAIGAVAGPAIFGATIEEALYRLLLDDDVITYHGAEIYPQEIYQGGVIPAIVYQLISLNRQYTHDGPIPLCSARFQINCWASTYSGAEDLADGVRYLLNAYSGVASGVTIHAMSLIGSGDIISVGVAAEESKRFGRWLDFRVHYNEML